MARTIQIGLGVTFVVVGLAGIALGAVRIGEGQTMHGLANVIVGGLVALHGVGTAREVARC